MESVVALGQKAKEAARQFATASTLQKDAALAAIADALCDKANMAAVLAANAKDLAAAADNGISDVMQDRLRLSEKSLFAMADGVRQLIVLGDPCGEVDFGAVRPNGLELRRVRVPLGVVGIIFESRPNVSVDSATLCLKSGNCCLLRGGKEAIHSNKALVALMRAAIACAGLPEDIILLVEDTSRDSANAMMKLTGLLDVLIPRGGAGLIKAVLQNAAVPVIETGAGNCHVYVDDSADLEMAANIIFNAKCSRPSTCNAAETLLVHRAVAEAFLPKAKARLDTYHVELRGCPETQRILGRCVIAVTDEDYATEFNDYILAVKVVEQLDEAVDHIARYSTHHSEAIVTSSYDNARRFTALVDSAAVYVNASTRFTDGGEFGFGAEIGISNQKLHARGPMGLTALTSVKYIVYGNGQVR